jgi:hypothetical protein
MVRLLRKKGQPIFILMIFLTFLISVPFYPALAALIETESVTNSDSIKDTRLLLNQLIAREDVRTALLSNGLNPVEAEKRIAALNDSEIIVVQRAIGRLPAGGQVAPDGGMVIFILVIAVLASLIILLLISGVVYGGIKAIEYGEKQEQEYLKSKPYPAPPRVGPVPTVNPNEPWTGVWKVVDGQASGVYILKQAGDSVVSTPESDFKVEAKVYGAMIVGRTPFDQIGNNFKAIIADDFLSFNGDINSQTFFICHKIESKSAMMNVKPSEPWGGKWRVQGATYVSGLWALKQEGETITFTSESSYRVRGKAAGDIIEGVVIYSERNMRDMSFKFVLSSDGKFFEGYMEEATGTKRISGIKVE